ncbi:PGF-CTERM sorting domain-containing protein [Natronolimnohabitans sp. A-GB9]|uniref:PGF-CTERM sorting domain-containing protein n=1 Tax=Natronolimnohabitans sp. A-GB9 TaxID=3069757 RepID=UPI0027B1DB31|nr:PGF-CTERM sorting domain-containing protein [Natronolimnohabitans sp. A-GB9]MDQ2052065.1 PGF-CTERM sorting domain-containing protein [Natronolimnohabitans sp. A-GB9]
MTYSRTPLLVGVIALCLIGVVGVGLIGGVGADTGTTPTDDTDVPVSEDAYVEPVPEEGDAYFEMEDPDGNWISYVNPRDEYRSPYLGDGSGKICVTLLNEAGEPVVGESVPDTTVTVPTGESLSWHPDADPMTVEYPLTDNYERPLDADQFGTTSDLPQGDGYLDSHCIEMHGLAEDATVEYGEAQIDGEHADDIEVVGYIQRAHDSWDSSIDPIEDAESYEEAGGGWTKYGDGSHGQAVVVLQLDGEERLDDGDGADDSTTGDDTESETTDETTDDASDDEMPGFGIVAVIAALAAATLLAARRSN